MSAGPRARLHSHPQYRWLVLATVGIGMMLAILSSSIVNIGLPSMTADLHSDLTTMTWVVTIFMITQATLMPVAGRAGDLYGHKLVFVGGLAWFALMSVFCALAWSSGALIAGRGLQAIASSALAPMGLAFVFNSFPDGERPQALGIMGGVMGTAPVLGLAAGGIMVDTLGWRSIFLFNVPLVMIIGPLAAWVLRESRPAGIRGFDIAGAALLTTGLYCGLLGLNQGADWGWTDPRIIGAFAVMAVLGALFTWQERRTVRPMIDLSLLRLRSLLWSNIASFFTSGAMFGTLLLLPFFFQSVLGESPASTGIELAPLALMYVITAPVGGRLTNRLGIRWTPVLGLLIAACGYFLLSRVLTVGVSGATVAFSTAVMGAGLGLTNAPLTTAALVETPPDKRGLAASLPNMFRFVGGSFCIAVITAFFTWRAGGHLMAAGLPEDQASVALGGATGEGGAVSAVPPAFAEPFAASFRDVFLFALVFVAIAIAAVLLMPQIGQKDSAGES